MSCPELRWALAQTFDIPTHKLVLCALVSFWNDKKGCAYPSNKALTDATGLNRKTVIRAMAQIRAQGLIEDSGKRFGGTGSVIGWRLCMSHDARQPDLFEVPASRPHRGATLAGPTSGPINGVKQAHPCPPSRPHRGATELTKEHTKEEKGDSALAAKAAPPPQDDDPNRKVTKAEVLEAWADRMVPLGYPAIRRMNKTRERQLAARISESTLDDWETVFDRLEHSKFCRGDNDRGWKADFDFLLQPKSFTKLMEGAYDH